MGCSAVLGLIENFCVFGQKPGSKQMLFPCQGFREACVLWECRWHGFVV